MSFENIPIRINGVDHLVDASWWNSIRTELIASLGDTGIVNGGVLTLNDTDTITPNLVANKQLWLVQGNAASVTLNAILFTTGHGLRDGQTIMLMGLSDTDTVKLLSSDALESLAINGPCTLGRFESITLMYILSINRFIEIGRNN